MDHPEGCRCEPCQRPSGWEDAAVLAFVLLAAAWALVYAVEWVRGWWPGG